jgi:hypothetical protein
VGIQVVRIDQDSKNGADAGHLTIRVDTSGGDPRVVDLTVHATAGTDVERLLDVDLDPLLLALKGPAAHAASTPHLSRKQRPPATAGDPHGHLIRRYP